MSVGGRNLLLDALVYVKALKRISRKLASPVMSHKLDLFSELRLDLQNRSLDEGFAVRLGTQTESLQTSAGLVHKKQQVLAATKRFLLHRAANVKMKQLK